MPITPAITGLTLRQLADREERAFPTYPQVVRYFPAATIEDARGRLGRAIERGDGPGLIIGGPGTGKSLLLQVLASQYHERFDVVLPACARLCTRRALLQAILFELGLPYRVRDEGDLRLSLLDHLLSREESPTGLLLLVDEAQTLSANLLDELRVLTNLVRGGTPRVRLVLAGSSALEESFAHPDLESFSQRLAARCYLAPFGREETIQFVRAQVAACGGSPEALFSGDAWDAIFEATDGVPRLVNQLCDRALIAASAGNREQVDRHSIQTAWAEIQQLPAPWETPPPTTAPPAPLQVVEFGELAETIDRNIREIDKLIASPGGLANKPDDDEFLVSEPTELDDEEQGPVAGPDTMKGAASVADGVDATPTDPFAEEFDEEEVVLDNFAGWDNMFRRDAPRVQNRRDPNFAALVQSAISTSDICEQFVAAPARTDFRMLDAELTNCGISTSDVPSTIPGDEVGSLDAANWPPLRLVKIAEPLKHLPAVESDETKLHEEWSRCKSPHWNDLVGSSVARDEDPVLIVEDDIPAPKSPVRREEYRNLFSRLRGD